MARIRVAQGQPLVHPDIVLVEITDASIRDLSEFVGRWPWPRALQAMIVDYISSGKPKVIALDLTFLEPERDMRSTQFLDRGEITSAQSDQELADAVRRAGNVIMLADAVDAGLDNGELIQQGLAGAALPTRAGDRGTAGRHAAVPGVDSRRRPGLDTTSSRSTPTAPPAASRRLSGKAIATCRSLGVAAALAGGGFRPEEVVLEGDAIRVRDRAIPARSRQGHRSDGPDQTSTISRRCSSTTARRRW